MAASNQDTGQLSFRRSRVSTGRVNRSARAPTPAERIPRAAALGGAGAAATARPSTSVSRNSRTRPMRPNTSGAVNLGDDVGRSLGTLGHAAAHGILSPATPKSHAHSTFSGHTTRSEAPSARRDKLYRSIGIQDRENPPSMGRWNGPGAGTMVVPPQYMRMAGGMTGRHNEKNRLKYKRALIPDTVDVDGDGEIDEWEIKMADYMHAVQKEDVVDMDGDGDVDADDLQLAREACGKKLIAEEFLDGLVAPLWMYDRSFIGKSRERLLGEVLVAPNFNRRMSQLRNKERLFGQSSSHLMNMSLRQPVTTRKKDRPLNETGFFKDTRATTYRERVRDNIFKRDKRKDFCRNKGDIPTYGNFANFKHIAVLNHINLAATGH